MNFPVTMAVAYLLVVVGFLIWSLFQEGIDEETVEMLKYTPEEVQRAVNNGAWQSFRKSLKGKPTQEKIDLLQCHWIAFGAERTTQIQIDNYIKALCRGGQLPKGTSLDTLVDSNWKVVILK